ncbi:zinc ribbon domain-containing protein [uncultured Thermanaerothrix sp.]|uniref:zinc ribbon domain-containing protein n=1 Tax=uncultured Thermanaerothrix sp. TaxID=1195149 RepID=UPI002608F515|nr:zinc ribbon domain-containing protein [uncultured Thermanaerothrix sp.]
MLKRLGVMFILVIVGLWLGMGHVMAQAGVALESLEIDLWPEYDRPEMLVIYRMSLANTVKLPAQVELRIPAAAGAPYNVAYEDTDGMLYNLSYTTRVEGGWLRVTFTTPAPVLQVEYYDPGLKKEGTKRTYEYLWPGDYAVKDLSIVVQQPLTATAWSLTPGTASPVKGNDGLVYYHYPVGELRAGTSFVLRLQYEKPDDRLSAPMQSVQPIAPIESAASDLGRSWYTLPWVMVISVGFVLILAGSIWWWTLTRQRPGMAARRSRHASRTTPSRPRELTPSQALYCPSCGRRVQAGDRFCRTCGTRLQQG